MLSSVLKSKRAIQVNIAIMRAFIKLREILATNKDLATKLADMEEKYDKEFVKVFRILQALMKPEKIPEKRRIGFIDTTARKLPTRTT